MPPPGYLPCNGSAVSRTTYADLFAVLGTHYGVGDGSTTFNLPNYVGQFLRGWDELGTVEDSARALHSAQEDTNRTHTHQLEIYSRVGGATATTSTQGGPRIADMSIMRAVGAVGNAWRNYESSNDAGAMRIASQGGESRPKNYPVLYFIKHEIG
jgi:microcystin-dependent protein